MTSDERGTVTWQPEQDTAVVSFCGDIDFELSEHATQVVNEAAATGMPVIADMSQIRFADSALLNLLLRTRQRHRLLIVGPVADAVMRVFDVTGTAGLFTFYPTRAAAQQASR
ncbi:STAS domain-containing protein [Streptomyces xanthochromogenes]|uniref:STAS domain-containing protein n=1 Tax=Streptomyces xanthochromogenes TaxID=67384 RepID=UPI003423921B